MFQKHFVRSCILALVVVATRGSEELEDRLLGAYQANEREFPFSVSIRYGERHLCGAALLSKRHVLTAAHCVHALKKRELWKINVLVGTNNLSLGGEVYNVSSMSQHPKYVHTDGPAWRYDIGLVKLASDVEFSDRVGPIGLPSRQPQPGDEAVVVGWGSPFRNVPPTAVLRKLRVHIIDRDKCLSIMPDVAFVHRYQLCTYDNKGFGTCLGDSGGPLVPNNTVIGVVSGGIPCAIGYPDVYTSVANFLPYIKSEMQN